MLRKNIRYGDIWMCNLEKRNGSVQYGYRPVFILSNDANNTHANTLNIIPLTTRIKRKLPVHVVLWDYKEYGLKALSVMLVEQVMTVSNSDLDFYVGRIDDKETLSNISEAILLQFSIK